MKYCISFILLLFCTVVSHSQESRTEIRIDFRANSAVIDSTYSDNAARLSEIVDFLRNVRQDSTLNIVEVAFCGSASPEGSDQLNRRLARGRLEALEKMVRKEVEIPDSVIIRNDNYIPWEYLRSQIEATDLSCKDEVMDILDEESILVDYHIPNTHIDQRIVKLRALDGGKVWKEIHSLFFEDMRNASAVFVTYKKEPVPVVAEVVLPEDVVDTVKVEDVVHEVEEPVAVVDTVVQEPLKPFYMSVKNNMLYDLALIPNIGLEFYLGNNISIAGNWMYSWWQDESVPWFWKTYGGDVALRYWFGKASREKALTGHHVGIYGQMLTYDFEAGAEGVLADRWNWSAGLEYGYSLPVASRLNIDFTVGAGYHWGIFEEYLPIDGHYVWQSTKRRQYIGPTKLEVSLVWLLGRGNYNINKKKNR